MRKQKCYIYMRVSTAMQVEGYSLEAQKDRLTKFAQFQDMEIVREYCDAGKSGKNITGRPEFSRMLQDVAEEKDGVSYILVFKLSRFGRNAADVLNSLQYIQDYGVNLICVEDGIDSSKDSGKLTITVLSAVAEIERENILVQTMEGRKQKAREGKWNGGQAPFGYELDSKNSTLIVNPEEAEIVRIIFDQFTRTEAGADSICKYLNQHGYTKKRLRDQEVSYFSRSTILKILDNPVYVGKIAYGKNKTEKVKGTRDQYCRVKQDEYLLADGLHDAIIDEETWEAAKEKRKRTGVRWVKTHSLDHEHILSGLIKCPLCGGGMSGTVQRRKNKKTGEYKDTFYYRCHHRKRVDGHICDYKPMLNQKVFNAEIEEFIRYMAGGEKFKEFLMEKLEEKVDVSSLEYLLADGLHDAIIDEETWEAAKEKRKRTGVRWVKTHSLDHEHILSGLIKCPLCGGGMSGTVQRRKNKKTGEYKDTFYYRCHHRKRVDGHICDYKPMLNQKVFNAEIEEFIRYMAGGEKFKEFLMEKLEEKVDVSSLEEEKKQLAGQLQQAQGSRKKLVQMLERLDPGDKHYDRKYQDMQERMDNLYDRIAELEEAITDVETKIGASYGKQVTGKKIYQFLLDFDILYGKMTDLEKKEFMRTFIESIELDPDEKDMGRIIKHIDLTFPVYYDGQEGDRIRMPKENTVEVACLLSRQNGAESEV